jgi:hypothetical protein
MVLATFDNTVLLFDPIRRKLPITMIRIAATIAAYSAMTSHHKRRVSQFNLWNLYHARK